MTGWFLNLVYMVLLAGFAPILGYRALVHGKYRPGWGEKLLGRGLERRSNGPCLWLHAVSVGEVLLLKSVFQEVKQRRPDLEIWISTTTCTGHSVACETFPDCRVFYFPLDFTWAVERALQRVRPDVVGLAELELWPNFVRAAARRGIPVVLVNGRLGDRSFRGYHRIRFLMRGVLQSFRWLGVQTADDAARLVALGAPRDRVVVTGSVKFDGVQLHRDEQQVAGLRRELGLKPADRVFLAGSTHAPEEQIALDCYRQLARDFPDLRLIIAPRHRERFDEVAATIGRAGFDVLRRTQLSTADGDTTADGGATGRAVILLDTLGELSRFWRLAEVAFVGGSFSRRGGQNMLEPSACGAAVVVGPNTWNFRHVVQWLDAAGGLCIVRDPVELTPAVHRLLSDREQALRMAKAARQVIAAHRGASERTARLLLGCCPESRSEPRAAA